jgi:hypothetical protein
MMMTYKSYLVDLVKLLGKYFYSQIDFLFSTINN